MKIFDYLERINLMNKLIYQRHTGTPKNFATRLGISESRLYCIVDDLRSMGAPIEYSRHLCTYYYSTPYEIDIDIRFGNLKNLENETIIGGQSVMPKKIYLTSFFV